MSCQSKTLPIIPNCRLKRNDRARVCACAVE